MPDQRVDDNQAGEQNSGSLGGAENASHPQADHNSIAINEIRIGGDVTGRITIGHGYTAEQVSQLLTQITTDFQRRPFDGRCPYKGLEVFEEEDADLFFGRERLVDDLVNRVRESRSVFITGPSGSGKSSLVRAGLLHALKQGAIRDRHSEGWLYATMKPGREPLNALALVFSRLKGPELADYFQAHRAEVDILNTCTESILSENQDQRFVLFIDQFEEVFTQVGQEAERQTFLHVLAHAATAENGRLIVLFAMRSDFVSNCATYPAINELLSQQFRQVGSMQPEELVSAMALPAIHVGLPIQEELIARIINDMKGEPGALPLMQFALKDLFDSQQEKVGVVALTLEDYLRHGGIQKSLEHHADNSFIKLSEREQGLARSIFSGLIEIGRGTVDTRRTALFDELVPANAKAEEVEFVVQKLADARLVITDEQAGKDTVTISHEKLIEAWPWLRKLVNENRNVIALQNEIASDAKEWDDHNRDESYLYTGARLANAREKLEANKIVLSGLAQLFIESGAKAYADELETARHSATQLRRRSVYLSVALGIALLAVGVATFFSIQSQRQAKISFARQLAALSVARRTDRLDLSFLLSMEAFRHAVSAGIPEEAQADLLNALINTPSLVRFLHGHNGPLNAVAFSPDGKFLASAGRGVILWDVASQRQLTRWETGQDESESLAFSPDGKILAAGIYGGKVILWDVRSGKQLGIPLNKHSYQVSALAFSPDGKILASGGYQGKIILWDIASQQPIQELLTNTNDIINSLAFSPDGHLLAIGSPYGLFIDNVLGVGQLIQPFGNSLGGISSVTFSPDGKILAASSTDKTIRLWNTQSYKQIGTPLTGHTKQVTSIAFSPDGKILVSGSVDKSIILWDVDSRREIGAPLTGHTDWISSVAFSPDGHTIAASSRDASISLWNLSRRQRFGPQLSGNTKTVYSVAFSPDGSMLASGGWDNSVRLWDVIHGTLLNTISTNEYAYGVNSVAFSLHGNLLASGGTNNTGILWEVTKDHQLKKRITLPTGVDNSGSIYNVAFSPDGKILALSTTDLSRTNEMNVILWDIGSNTQIGSPLLASKGGSFMCCPAVGAALAFSPDGKLLATGSGYTDGVIKLWDVASQQPLGSPLIGHTAPVYSVAFSPDGKILASASYDKSIILWDVASHRQLGQPLTGHTDSVNSLAFRPDGKILASGSTDNNIILWDVSTHKPLGEPLTGHWGTVVSVAFSPDGKTLASGSEDTNILLWDVDPDSWKEEICNIAGRNLTRSEWAQYFPNEEYRATCPQWPLEPDITASASPTP